MLILRYASKGRLDPQKAGMSTCSILFVLDIFQWVIVRSWTSSSHLARAEFPPTHANEFSPFLRVLRPPEQRAPRHDCDTMLVRPQRRWCREATQVDADPRAEGWSATRSEELPRSRYLVGAEVGVDEG